LTALLAQRRAHQLNHAALFVANALGQQSSRELSLLHLAAARGNQQGSNNNIASFFPAPDLKACKDEMDPRQTRLKCLSAWSLPAIAYL
jgi:hypothetical protein